MRRKEIGIYVHIPFCKQKCSYCDFCSYAEKEELKDFSVVTFKHRIGNKDLGTIGIIGPKRMDYAKVISVMKYISKKLNGE